MCIAILKPKGIFLYDWVFRNSFAWHPDGAGFLVHNPENNTLICKKGFFTLESFLEAFEPYKDDLCLIHFRKTTHGEKNEENCHPFMVNENLGFIHNGVIPDVRMWDKTKSDTWHFNEAMMKKLFEKFPVELIHNSVIKVLIEEWITKRSKLIFLDNTGQHSIINSKGVWDSSCWFSNDSYKFNPYDVNSLCSNKKAFKRIWESLRPDSQKEAEAVEKYWQQVRKYQPALSMLE